MIFHIQRKKTIRPLFFYPIMVLVLFGQSDSLSWLLTCDVVSLLICSCLVAVFIHFKSHPFSSSYFDAMASWYSTRSRSRTASRPRPLLFALLPGHPDLRMTTQTLLTTRPPAALTMTALHVGNTQIVMF